MRFAASVSPFFVAPILSGLVASACGVKGPPLPPVDDRPDRADVSERPNPFASPSPTPSPSPSPTPRKKKR